MPVCVKKSDVCQYLSSVFLWFLEKKKSVFYVLTVAINKDLLLNKNN